MTTLALLGAGGKMGFRLSRNLQGSRFDTRHVEINPDGAARLRAELGIDCVPLESALSEADAVILVIPDTAIGAVSHQIAPLLRPGTMVVVLDAAAPHAGRLPQRDDLTYFVTHPCHPSVFNYEPTREAHRDFFGGSTAKQSITCALMQGPESAWDLGEEIARTIYAPVERSHRLTVEQMALLEPCLSETLAATLLTVLRQGLDECIARGVPKEAARDFILGHINVELAVLFNETPGAFSDACHVAVDAALPVIINPDWKSVFEPEKVVESVKRIT
ncbi:phosphogluconate dehydrogenase C-terminal domain-containing protein [Telmatospirillum sp. J64-1]|uniref:phosphogluconate dehydrogenase C-terminal domain-containing protein n=1 Tax=Telmatospirillum sp. J64-1 TaxID=2502183 RepID=UPI00115C7BE3|nr:phosphogluconate dehydrogenase C-terminal domain-containing protein [Telmatospirillum sp. J64-1]